MLLPHHDPLLPKEFADKVERAKIAVPFGCDADPVFGNNEKSDIAHTFPMEGHQVTNFSQFLRGKHRFAVSRQGQQGLYLFHPQRSDEPQCWHNISQDRLDFLFFRNDLDVYLYVDIRVQVQPDDNVADLVNRGVRHQLHCGVYPRPVFCLRNLPVRRCV